MYIYQQLMQSPFEVEGTEELSAESTLPQTERPPFVTETVKYIVLIDPLDRISIEENKKAILKLEERVSSLESDKAGVKHFLSAINSLGSRKLQLKQPLTIVLRETVEDFIAELSDINAWGHGETEQEAVENLCVDLENLYFSLKKEQKKLGKEMQRQWSFLKKFIKEAKKK